MRNTIQAAVLALVATLVATEVAYAAGNGDDSGGKSFTRANLDGSTAVVRAGRAAQGIPTGSSGTPVVAEEFRRAPAAICGFDNDFLERQGFGPDCDATTPGQALVVTFQCEPTERAVAPLFRRTADPNAPGGWTPWEILDNGCMSVADIRAAVAEAFQRLPLTPSTLSVQPPSGWTLVNADTVAFADGRTQDLSTTVLGLNVVIRATPESFTWGFGDGSEPLTTADPGRPWPDHTVAHRYTSEGTRSVTLTTTWSATYQVAGSTEWEPVDGTATTTSTSEPLTVYEARARLVDASAD